jgi:hypothetical protein
MLFFEKKINLIYWKLSLIKNAIFKMKFFQIIYFKLFNKKC